MGGSRRILTAELLSIGTELTVGETRDTNAGELARSLTGLGVRVGRIQALPDDLSVVSAAFGAALERADVVVSTGGLGPTPDDLTREAIAAVADEEPAVDPELEAWLRQLWSRRGMPFPELNLKQAWLIPSATALPNDNGTAPGWWVVRPDGRIIVALPGPPREMRPIWSEQVVPRLRAVGVGSDTANRTFRLAGIGESQLADILGEDLLRQANPIVATYARADAVDVRVSAVGDDDQPGARSAGSLVDATAEHVLGLIGPYVWAEGETTWPEAIGAALEAHGWTLACVEVGTGGSLAALLGDRPWLGFTESLSPDAPGATAHADTADDADDLEHADGAESAAQSDGLEALARRAMAVGGATVGMAVRARPRGDDTAISVVVVRPEGVHRERRLVFLGGAYGRSRTGLAAAAILLGSLRAGPAADGGQISGETPARGPRGRGRRCCPGRAGSGGRR